MAQRLRKTHQEDVRTKIQTSQLINKLQNHVFGKEELSKSQIKAIEILIRKTLPDLSTVHAQHSNPDGSPLDFSSSAETEVQELFGKPRLIVSNG